MFLWEIYSDLRYLLLITAVLLVSQSFPYDSTVKVSFSWKTDINSSAVVFFYISFLLYSEKCIWYFNSKNMGGRFFFPSKVMY